LNVHHAHILAVDDDDRLRELLKRFLAREGHDVTTAKDAASARKLLATMTFDLIILDVMMPDRRGSEIAYEIRNTDKIKQIPILFLTATAMKGQKELFGGLVDGLPFTIKPTVSKPVSTADLIKAIESQLPKPTDE